MIRRVLYGLAVLLTVAAPARAQFDLSQCEVKGSDPSVLAFPRTARFESFGVGVPSAPGRTDGYIDVRTSGTDHWPAVPVPPYTDPSQSGTLWIFERIGGRCYATGAERLRPTQLNGHKPQGSAGDLIGTGWLYDVNRWGPMAGRNPQPGERIGLMVAAGSTRSDNNTPVRERTDVIEIVWPGAAGRDPVEIVWREGENAPPAAPGPSQTSTAPPAGPTVDQGTIAALAAQVTALTGTVEAIREWADGRFAAEHDERAALASRAATLEQRVDLVERRPTPALQCHGYINLIVVRIPFGACRVEPE